MKPFQKSQLEFTHYLREPLAVEAGEFTGNRRKEIYRDLVYNNIERCISETFPITRNIISDDSWHCMICDFITNHNSQTPYFFEICQEFLAYLTSERMPSNNDFPFMLELAHFEWIRLALDIANLDLPKNLKKQTPSELSRWRASPLLMTLSYRYPVDKIDECHLPTEPPGMPTYILAYRDTNDDVKTQSVNILTLRLAQVLQEHINLTAEAIFNILSAELKHSSMELSLPIVQKLLCDLASSDIVFYTDESHSKI